MTVLSVNLHLSTLDHKEGVRRISSPENHGFFWNPVETKSFGQLFPLSRGEGCE
jgi:hypothetical protein